MASAPETVALAIRGPIALDDLPGLCARACRLVDRTPANVVRCDVTAIAADAVTVEALARLELGLRRRGRRAHFRGASSELLELVDFMGLSSVLRFEP
jgi:ABC-type transporter Mla MlaB component